MIQEITVEYQSWIKILRKQWNETYISSVALSGKGIDTYRLRKLCDRNPKYHAICFDIAGSIKYWFDRNTIEEMIKEIK